MSKSTNLGQSFSFAFQGLKSALKKEPNFRLHAFIAGFAMILAIFLKLNFYEWAILIFTIFFVLIMELLNTTLEAVVNLVSPEINPQAKIAKDVSAAFVLMSAAMAVIIGLIIFLPKILALLQQ
jgi:diacylglycerol kinase